MKILIENFKSIKKLEFELSKINILIGPSASGKSNILEALAFSNLIRRIAEFEKGEIKIAEGEYAERDEWVKEFLKYLRIKIDDELSLRSTFFGKSIRNGIIITLDDRAHKFEYEKNGFIINHPFYESISLREPVIQGNDAENILEEDIPIRLYRGIRESKFYSDEYFLEFGEFGREVSYFLGMFEKKINTFLNEVSNLSLISREEVPWREPILWDTEIGISYHFENLSDGLKKLLYLYLAVKSNEEYRPNLEKILLLEEPEVRVFPYYTNCIAELLLESLSTGSKICFILSTHNNQFLEKFLMHIEEKGERYLEDLKILYIERDAKKGTYIKQSYSGKEAVERVKGGEYLIKLI